MKKRRQMRMTYVASGESVLAEMLDDEAPSVCAHVWDRLPMETKVIHGMYSGLEVFAMVNNPEPVPSENMVQLPLPGELLYFTIQAPERSEPKNRLPRLCSYMAAASSCAHMKVFQPNAHCSPEFQAIGSTIGSISPRNAEKHDGKGLRF